MVKGDAVCSLNQTISSEADCSVVPYQQKTKKAKSEMVQGVKCGPLLASGLGPEFQDGKVRKVSVVLRIMVSES